MATTIIDELKRIQESKINMRSVIESKGVGVDPEATIDKYPDFIEQIEGGSTPVLDTLNVTANGTYVPTSPLDGYDEVIVNVQPNLTTLTATSNNTYYPTAPAQGFSSVTVNVQPGAQESSVTLYYNMNQEKLYSNSYMTNDESWWIFNPEGGGSTLIQNVDKMYIDGVLQNSIEWKHKFTTGGMHTVKLVMKSNANEIPDWSLRDYKYIDTRNFTGTLGVLDYNMNENFYILPENITIGGPGGGGYYYLPASTDFRQNDRHIAFPFWVDVNHQNYTSNANGTLVMDASNNIIGIGSNAYIPDTVTTFNPANITIQYYANEFVFSKKLTDFYGIHSGVNTLAFLGAVPPTITPDQSEAEGHIFVPSGSESAYRTAFTNAGWNNMAANVNPINVATATFTYASGDYGIIIANGMDDASSHNILLVEIYDSNSNIVWRECPTNELNIMGEMLNGYGDYTVKMYFADKVYDWASYPHCLFNYSTATSVDFSAMVTANFDYRIIANMPNVTEVTLSDSITSIGRENFYNCPNLSKVVIMAPQPPTVSSSGDDNVFANSNGGNPIDVIVPDPSAYEADGEWAALKANGLITFSTL